MSAIIITDRWPFSILSKFHGFFNKEKALLGAFSVITNLRMEVFEALELGLPAADRRMGAEYDDDGDYSDYYYYDDYVQEH